MELYLLKARMVPFSRKLLLALSCVFTAVGEASTRASLLHVQSKPIVTGCLDACGYKDTQCVTECQVCVEHRSCGTVNNCRICEKQVLQMRRHAIQADPRSTDSGGKSLIHEGLRVKYLKAQQDLQDTQHNLMVAREGVITAQTSAEYSTQELEKEEHELREARAKKLGAQETVHRWSKKNEARLERARRRLREAEQEAAEEQKKLRKANAELRRARRRVRKAKRDEADEEVIKKAEEEEWEAQRRVEQETKEVDDAKESVRKRKREAKWVDKHLRKQVEGKQNEVERAVDDLAAAEQREKKALQVLQYAREKYAKQIKRSEAAEDRVTRLEKELDDHPVAGPSQKQRHDQKLALHYPAHSPTHSSTGSGVQSSVTVLSLLSLWIAL